MKTPAELTVLFRDRGFKVTPQRQCIFRVMHNNGSHPTAHSVFEAVRAEMPTVSLRTIYQTLNDLVDLSELQQVDVGRGAVRFDPATDHHHHLVCSRCGEVRDVHQDFGALRLPVFQQQGFSIFGAEVVFRGLCAACSEEPSPKK
ncbi:MAG: Fur family transcriptional regulator [Acidimicrobiales bacterium]